MRAGQRGKIMDFDAHRWKILRDFRDALHDLAARKRGYDAPSFIRAHRDGAAGKNGGDVCFAMIFCVGFWARFYLRFFGNKTHEGELLLSLIHISEPTRQAEISYAV